MLKRIVQIFPISGPYRSNAGVVKYFSQAKPAAAAVSKQEVTPNEKAGSGKTGSTGTAAPNMDRKRDYREILLNKLQSQKSRYALCRDNYRLDVGLIIDRNPIFLSYSETQMQRIQLRYSKNKKYKLNLEIPQELSDFKVKDPTEEFEKQNSDNVITHTQKVAGQEKIENYNDFAQYFKLVDPTIIDNQSIQHMSCENVFFILKDQVTQQWVLPTKPMIEKENFSSAKASLFDMVSLGQWNIHHMTVDPYAIHERQLTDEERKNAQNRNAVGVRTFFFLATHLNGIVSINQQFSDEYAWVSQRQLNQFFTQSYFDKMNVFFY